MTERVLFDLLSWMSPAWPVGAFAHSSGLEWAVEEGLVTDCASTEAWLVDWIERGAGSADAILFVFAHRAAAAGDGEAIDELCDIALALQTSAERRLESVAQGGAFRRIARSTAACAALSLLDGRTDEDIPYPVIAACLTAGHGAPLDWSLTAYLHAACANMVSAAQRLVPLGQTDGQRALAALREPILAAAHKAAAAKGDPLEHIGSAMLIADFAAMAHETQYTRLFRT